MRFTSTASIVYSEDAYGLLEGCLECRLLICHSWRSGNLRFAIKIL
jgi:hypothetical protein